MYKLSRIFAIFAVLLTLGFALGAAEAAPEALSTLSNDAGEDGAMELKSPNGDVVVYFDIRNFEDAEDCAAYRVAYKERTVVDWSRLGFELEDAESLTEGFAKYSTSRGSAHGSWRTVYGERAVVPNNYNELKVTFGAKSERRMTVTLRAYNEGAALRYSIACGESMGEYTISRERTEFAFAADHECWATYSAQGKYAKVRLSQVKRGCERPLTVRIDDGLYAAVGEAALVDFARMKLGPAGRVNTLVSDLSSEVVVEGNLVSPWRVVLLGETPGRLLESNYLFLNLNEPCAIEDTSWIKPGKVIREVTLTTAGGKACVDFASEHGLQFVEFDAGWYGHEYSDESDATTITVDPRRSKGPLDLHEVIRYAQSKGIGIILYVNRRALEKQLDEVLPLYSKWGIKGLKYGFVRVGSQQWTSWLHEAIRKAAEHELMVDVHDEYRPTGYSRTYPNFMTQEGIRGDETKPTNELTLTILFTRMLCGAGDNTICYYDTRVDRNSSHAYQLAKAVCFYSPWQFLYWYDRPLTSPRKAGGAGGQANIIGDEPELEFFDHVPTVWDQTKVIHGEIGSYAVIARRSGSEWYIGCMNAGRDRTLDMPLDFLDKNTKYTAHIYSDDPDVPTRTHVRIERRPVDCTGVLEASMGSKGGMAVRITPGVR